MTLSEFADIFATLAIQLRQTDADEATIRVYFATLRDVEPEYLALAATRLAKTAEWFPKTSEWRAMATKVEAERREAQRVMLRQLPSPLCAPCADTGWAQAEDGRVQPCACREVRRLELLGRRPWPALPATASPGLPPNPDDPIGREEAVAFIAQAERVTGLRIVPKAMPRARVTRPFDDEAEHTGTER